MGRKERVEVTFALPETSPEKRRSLSEENDMLLTCAACMRRICDGDGGRGRCETDIAHAHVSERGLTLPNLGPRPLFPSHTSNMGNHDTVHLNTFSSNGHDEGLEGLLCIAR